MPNPLHRSRTEAKLRKPLVLTPALPRVASCKKGLVQEACNDFPGTPTKTLARKLYADHGQLWPTFDACYQAIRTARGNHGTAMRHRPIVTARRPNQPAGFRWIFPKSSAEPWTPFVLETERNLALSDLHIPFHDPAAIHAVVRAGEKFLRNSERDAIILNGDVCDFFSISRFDKNPTKSSLKKEIDLTRQFLGWLRQKFPRNRIIYKFGNHDEWFDKYLWRKAPELFGLPQIRLPHLLTSKSPGSLHRSRTEDDPRAENSVSDRTRIASCENSGTPEIDGIEFVTDQQKITLGHLDVLHGHELGKGSIAPPVNPARGFFLKTMECTLAGHLHRSSTHRERTSKGKQIACWSTGCLCGLWPDYAKINKWNQGGARIDLSGMNFSVTLLDVIDGKVV
jgi:hypothetical protein